ncbi:MAG: hypothetical protein HQL69_10745 [Magnetococcales bacterium]|nr:hypothetical protein [Magnetococcales bacterium]
MALKRMKRFPGIDENSKDNIIEVQEDPNGRFFEAPDELIDLQNINIVGTTVDTVRPMFSGKLKEQPINNIINCIENRGEFLSQWVYAQWHVSKVGRSSGFTYKLQNNEIGVIVLIKSQYKAIDKIATHVKIELSPQFIQSRTPKQITSEMRTISSWLLEEPEPAGVHVHMAVDVQGWQPSEDFESLFVTRARTKRVFDGIANVEFEGLSSVAMVYGQRETFMYGKASALQACIYRKDIEIVKRDKQDYMHELWSVLSDGLFDSEKPVWRVELRFHHSVIQEIGIHLEQDFLEFESVVPYLTDIWRYGMNRNRLMYNRQYLDPFWQLLDEDCEFYVPAKQIQLKRVKKKGGECIIRNCSIFLGNMITLYARRGDDGSKLWDDLYNMDIYDDLIESYEERGKDIKHLYDDIIRGVKLRKLIGKAA